MCEEQLTFSHLLGGGGTGGTGGGGQELLARFPPDLYGRRSAPARSRTRPDLCLCASPLLHQPFGSEIWTKDKSPHVPSAWTHVLIQALSVLPPFAFILPINNQQDTSTVLKAADGGQDRTGPACLEVKDFWCGRTEDDRGRGGDRDGDTCRV